MIKYSEASNFIAINASCPLLLTTIEIEMHTVVQITVISVDHYIVIVAEAFVVQLLWWSVKSFRDNNCFELCILSKINEKLRHRCIISHICPPESHSGLSIFIPPRTCESSNNHAWYEEWVDLKENLRHGNQRKILQVRNWQPD